MDEASSLRCWTSGSSTGIFTFMQPFCLFNSLIRMWRTCICRMCGCKSEAYDAKEETQRLALYLLLIILFALTVTITYWVVAISSGQETAFRRWAVALGYVIVWGHVAGFIFLCALRDCYIRLPPAPHEPKDFRLIPPGFLGLFERLIFTVGVGGFASDLGPILAAMGVWLLLKLISGWNRAPVSILDYSQEDAFR
jgi:hypothetical protein